MVNTQININENGTKTLAAAGKYCDRNIDVNVDVAGKPTQLTNVYDPANVTVRTRLDASTSIENGYAFAADNQTNMIVLPYHHKKGEAFDLRMRGIGTVRDRNAFAIFDSDGTTKVNHYQLSSTSYFELYYDEHGDATIKFKGSILNYEWYFAILNIQYPTYNTSPTAPLVGPVITINEPIGNGGYVG